MKGGGSQTKLPTIEQINMRFEEPAIKAAWERGVANGNFLKDRARFGIPYVPFPKVAVRSWSEVKVSQRYRERRKTRRSSRYEGPWSDLGRITILE